MLFFCGCPCRNVPVYDIDANVACMCVLQAGHAIIGALLPEYDPVQKISIVPRGATGGATFFAPNEEQLESGLYSRTYLENRMAVSLGGRVAEELILGPDDVTTGAANDFQQVRSSRALVMYCETLLGVPHGYTCSHCINVPAIWRIADVLCEVKKTKQPHVKYYRDVLWPKSCRLAKESCRLAKESCRLAKESCQLAKESCQLAKESCQLKRCGRSHPSAFIQRRSNPAMK
jgi:hypothetical protein